MKELKKIAKRYYFKHILICVLVQMMLFYAPFPNLMANPNPAPGTLPAGPTTPYGGVGSFDYTSGRLDIQNVTNGAVINWHKFDIGAGATTQFHQVSSSAYVLNRVNASDGMATGIKGNLIANGGVIVINPHGIVMGPSALINAGKFIASGLGMSDKDFRDFASGAIGVLKFDAGCLSDNVTNSGTINAGEVYLVGKNVTNTGTISCPGGMVVMAAGEKVYLAQSGSNVFVEKLDTGSNAGDHRVTAGGNINTDGAGVLLAAGDILSQAAITNARSFVAQADRDITIEDSIQTTGDITIWADMLGDTQGDVLATAEASITANAGNVTIKGNEIKLYGPVRAGVDASGNIITPDKDITITGRDCWGGDKTEWRDVWAYDTLDASGDISISTTGEQKEWVDGHWEGRTWIEGHWEQGRCGNGEWVSGHWEGGWYVPGYWDTSYAPGTIYLYGDVTAHSGNLTLYNNTYAGPGITLKAGNNIVLANDGLETTPPGFCNWLTGDTWLAIRAGIEIVAPKTVISVIGSTLIMEQGLSLNLDNYLFANQANTNLTLISNHGSVTAVETGAKPENAADQWKSIGATADNGSDNGGNAILLSGNQKDVVTTELRAYHDDITVNAKAAKVRATENVTADIGSITLIGNTGIDVSKNLTAGNGITLDGVVTAVGVSTQTFEAGAGTLWAKNTVTKTGPGDLHLAGDAGVDLDGTVDVEAGSLEIENDFTAAGDLLASDNITTKNGILDGTADQRIDAKGGKLHANGTLTKTGAGNLNLGGQTGIDLDGTVDVMEGSLVIEDDFQAAGDLLASDNVTLNGAGTLDGISDQKIEAKSGTVYAGGALIKTTAGRMSVLAADGITLTDAAEAQDSMLLNADTDEDGLGDMLAQSTLTTTTGNIEISASDTTIKLQDNVSAGQDLILNNNTEVAASKELKAGQDVTLAGGKTITGFGDLTVNAGRNIGLSGDVTAGQDLVMVSGVDTEAQGNLTATSGSITASAGNNILLKGNATAGQNITLSAVADVEAQGNLSAGQDVVISSSDNTTYLGGNVNAGNSVVLNNNTQLNGAGDQSITAQNGTVLANGTIAKINEGRMSVLAADGITLTDAAEAQDSMLLNADTDEDGLGDMLAQSTLTTTTGNIEISASDNTIKLQDNVSAGQDLILNNNTEVAAGKKLDAGRDVTVAADKTLKGKGALTVEADRHITLGGDVVASDDVDGDLVLWADKDGDNDGDMTAYGTIYNAGGSINIYSSDGTTYLGGDVYAGHDILLNDNTKVNGYGDQTLDAGNKLTALGYVRKGTPGDMYLKGNSEGLSIDLKYNSEGPGTSTSQGNLWILGQGDIQISGDVTTFGPSEYISIQSEIAVVRSTGGVAIISDEGKIYTRGGDDDTLNVSVTGSSDHFNKTGVYGFGLYADEGDIEPTILAEADNTEAKAAIAIVSADELKIGENGKLTAYGTYYDNVDDRSAIGFLDTEAQIPDGTSRSPGVPFDLAIYTASRDSSVTVKAHVMIESEPIFMPTVIIEKKFLYELEHVAEGAMAIDAYDIVTLGDEFMQSLANGDIGNRLEVCSRITEWLEDAAGRLPFLDSSDLPQEDYSYVMRGAGLENPGITDGRAWVLEKQREEIFVAAAPIQQPELKFTGCPAVMNWIAKELGVEKDQIQIYVAGAMAMSSNVQPCDSCARLKNTALVLMDADGAQVKALGEIVNEFTAAGAPPSEEQMAMIASSLKNPEEGTRYALAAQWLDALAEYINILHSDMNLPVDESMAFAAKYTSPVTGGDNAALAAYVQAKMDALGG